MPPSIFTIRNAILKIFPHIVLQRVLNFPRFYERLSRKLFLCKCRFVFISHLFLETGVYV